MGRAISDFTKTEVVAKFPKSSRRSKFNNSVATNEKSQRFEGKDEKRDKSSTLHASNVLHVSQSLKTEIRCCDWGTANKEIRSHKTEEDNKSQLTD